jgi:hypothetical protein
MGPSCFSAVVHTCSTDGCICTLQGAQMSGHLQQRRLCSLP